MTRGLIFRFSFIFEQKGKFSAGFFSLFGSFCVSEEGQEKQVWSLIVPISKTNPQEAT